MRAIAPFLVIAALSGCATVTTAVREDGLSIKYTGDADGAVRLISAADGRPFELAKEAVHQGMPVSVERDAQGDLRFKAGYGGYGYVGGNVGGYAAPDVVSVPGGWYAPTGAGSSLPVLGRTVATGAGSDTAAADEFVTREEFHALIRNIKK